MKNIFFTDVSVKRQITDSISENLTDSDLESNDQLYIHFLFQNVQRLNYILIINEKVLVLCENDFRNFHQIFTF